MGALKTSMNSSIRVGAVGTVDAAEVESPTSTLGTGMQIAANMDMAVTWAVVLFLAAVVFLYIIL